MKKQDTVKGVYDDIIHHLNYTLATPPEAASGRDVATALALSVRDRLVDRWMKTTETYYERNVKRVYYLSMEYLIGRAMGNNVINLGLEDEVRDALKRLGHDWDDLREVEVDAGLGNGGLGRLAACFLDSMATLQLPGFGYGVRYDYGIFRQVFRNGYQVEEPDNWMRHGDPWQIERPEYQVEVRFGGRVSETTDARGRLQVEWVDGNLVYGVPYDLPIPGFENNTVNNLRLWSARSDEQFDLEFFNNGDYIRAYEQKLIDENITKVLYPNDNIEKGKKLRFQQEYFFASCSLQDILRRFKRAGNEVAQLHEKTAIQLNDTHPAIAVAELMRILLDEERLPWDQAWHIVTHTFGYTNHTLMPEALEIWPVRLFEELLPRHLKIIYEINRRFLRRAMTRFPEDHQRIARMSLIQEGDERQVRMAYLAVLGSHSVNGVSALHTELIKKDLLRDFYELEPHKFNNKTNGITPRRWLLKANPGLASLVSERIGRGWITDLDELRKLEDYADDPETLAALDEVKQANKQRLAEVIATTLNLDVPTNAIFDVQVKRLHEYKRQLLNVLHILYLYFQLKDDPSLELMPRVFVFAAKAAPGYQRAKLIIKLINDVAGIINQDEEIEGKLKVAFLPDYRVSLAERIIPAADVSEQISTAGTEASGTGNMKLALNGALTLGTLDGANIEIRDHVGEENFFLFGLRAEQVQELRSSGNYNPSGIILHDPVLLRLVEHLRGDYYNLDEPGVFAPLYRMLMEEGDYYLHAADFHDYARAQHELAEAYRDRPRWLKMSLLNIARMGAFSSDRTIAEYAEDIWGVEPCPVEME